MINVTSLNKWFSDFHVLKNINLTINKGERVVVVAQWVGKVDTYSLHELP